MKLISVLFTGILNACCLVAGGYFGLKYSQIHRTELKEAVRQESVVSSSNTD